MRGRAWSVFLVSALTVACGSSKGGAGGDGGVTRDGGGHGGTPPGVDAASESGHAVVVDASTIPDAPTLPSALACTPAPIGPADVSHPTTVVGTGSGTCTAAALTTAVAKGGIITFDCGGPTTITLTAPLSPPTDADTTIDGGGTVTLDGGHTSRILSVTGPGYRTTSSVITLQHLTMQNGLGTGDKIPAAPPPCSQGYQTTAGGGAVYISDAELHVIDDVFTGNTAATPGPDVGGGAIYVDGSLSTVIVGSRFAGNTASNGGAVGSLNTDLSIYGSTFEENSATGSGQNTISSACTAGNGEVGDGGSGGAIYLDGGHDGDTIFCGDVFSKNHANALGGAIFRVFDDAAHNFNISASTFDGNVADGPAGTTDAGSGGGAFYASGANVNVVASTLSNNSSLGCGAAQMDTDTIEFVNVTLSKNSATDGVGGAVCSFSGGTFQNCTFGDNSALGGTSYSNWYSAAIFGSTVTVENTIFDDNTTDNSEGRMTCGATENGDNDIQWPKDHTVGGAPDSPCTANITFVDGQLGTLQNNGGPTETMLPGAAASVIQIGTACPKTDQRGNTRASPCTIGAVEVMPASH